LEVHELLATDDARVWAREFVLVVREHKDIPLDVPAMEGWFANAMCAARDAEARRRQAAAYTETPAQKVLREKHGTPNEFEQAAWAAHAQLFATTDETLTAIAKYRNEWAVAGDLLPATVPTNQADEVHHDEAEAPQDQVPDS
jgi:hypothetical protein